MGTCFMILTGLCIVQCMTYWVNTHDVQFLWAACQAYEDLWLLLLGYA